MLELHLRPAPRRPTPLSEEAPVAVALSRSRSRSQHSHKTATDQLLTMATLALAAVALVLAVFQAWNAGAVVAFVAVLTGGWAQLVSETRTERFENIFAITLSAVVLMVCLAGGGAFTS